MRTNIVIDDAVLEEAMRAGPFKSKKDAVDAGLKLLARQAAYREILRYQGKLKWDDDPLPVTEKRRDRVTSSAQVPSAVRRRR